MVFLRVTLIVLFLIAAVSTFGLYRLGAFEQPVVQGLQTKQIPVVLMTHKLGPYHETVFDLQSLVKALYKNQLHPQFCFAEYWDNPDQVPLKKLRSNLGCAFNQKEPLSSGLTQEIGADYQWSQWASRQVLVVHWPAGPALGAVKVYPAATNWFKSQQKLQDGAHVLEIYPFLLNEKISETQYWFPIKTN